MHITTIVSNVLIGLVEIFIRGSFIVQQGRDLMVAI